ncbi:MAG: GNAT family N-acetyltransferase [bacterium]|nr:GNAT family N-acetyltransferase [bacterium]
MRVLRTERLRLEPATEANATLLWRVLQEPDLREFQDLPDVDAAQFEQIVAARPRRLEAGVSGRFEWLLYLEGVPEPAGWVSLRLAERASATAEIGYSVLREFRGRGVATEAVRAVVGEAFACLSIRRLRAYCVPENTASRRVLERAGFVADGVLPHGATVRGRPVDVMGYIVERDAFSSGQRTEIPASG